MDIRAVDAAEEAEGEETDEAAVQAAAEAEEGEDQKSSHIYRSISKLVNRHRHVQSKKCTGRRMFSLSG